MTNYQHGQQAEVAATQYLQDQGYKILARNWRTRYCEIDIVAMSKDTIYFVEVKYRATSRQGTGLDYITPKKLQQMRFAAEIWITNHHWYGEVSLAALEVSGPNYKVTNLLTDI